MLVCIMKPVMEYDLCILCSALSFIHCSDAISPQLLHRFCEAQGPMWSQSGKTRHTVESRPSVESVW